MGSFGRLSVSLLGLTRCIAPDSGSEVASSIPPKDEAVKPSSSDSRRSHPFEKQEVLLLC